MISAPPRSPALVCFLLILFSAASRAGVLISEFLSSNQNAAGLRDEDLDLSDWIELTNTGPSPARLKGWHLTDRLEQPKRWEFPDVTLAPGAFLTVFASGKDRAEPGRELHTDFSLKKSGEVLALTRPDGTVEDIYDTPDTPEQSADISYGRLTAEADSARGFFIPPSPGWPNNPADSPPDPPGADPGGGCFTDTASVSLTSSAEHAEIRYTLDGSVPDAESALYSGPLVLGRSARLRAVAVVPGRRAGLERTAEFLQMTAEAAEARSNLPLLVIDTFGSGRPEADTQAAWMVFLPDGTGFSSLTGKPQMTTAAKVKVRGSSTATAAKYSLAVEAQTVKGADREVSPAGLPAEADWVLNAPFEYDRSLIRNPLMYQLSNDAGRYAVRTRAVELYLNTDGGPVSAADYAGVYTLMERIERGANRVAVEKLDIRDHAEPAVAGGYVLKIDRAGPGETGFLVDNQRLYWVDPAESSRTVAQRNWITSYLNAWHTSLSAADFFDPVNGYARRADPASFIDHHLLNVAAKNVDALRLSAYFSKSRYGRLTAGPVWDFDRAMDSTDVRDDHFDTWRGEGSDGGTDYFEYDWYREMFVDPNFRQHWIDRLEELRHGALSDAHVSEEISRQASELKDAAARNFRRWPEKPPRFGGWPGEVEHLREWFLNRLQWMDAQFTRPPVADRTSGSAQAGGTVSLTSSSLPRAGTHIYFTTDGTDPRPFDSTQGQMVLTDFPVTGNSPVRARLPLSNPGTAWREGGPFDDSAWLSGAGGVGYDDTVEYDPYIGLNLEYPPASRRMKSLTQVCLVRYLFSMTAERIAALDILRLRMRYDDGFIVWLNGSRLASINAPDAGAAWNAGATANHPDSAAVEWHDIAIPDAVRLLKPGENLLAVQGLNYGLNSTDFLIQAELTGGHKALDGPGISATAQVYTGPVALNTSMVLTARTYDPAGPFHPYPNTGEGSGRTPVGSHWSAPLRLIFPVNAAPAAAGLITISEIMYHPAAPSPGQEAQGFLHRADFEFIELMNISDGMLNLTGLAISGGASFVFPLGPSALLPPGGTVVLASNAAAFAARYGTDVPLAGTLQGHLGNAGDVLTLTAADGTSIQTVRFGDSAPWPVSADGGGASLELSSPASHPLPGKAISWHVSGDPGGTPAGQTVTTFAVWRQRYFPDGGADSGPDADPDDDGIPNLLEFACGSTPLAPDFIKPDCTLIPGGRTDQLSLWLRRRKILSGTWTLESSPDLEKWTAVPCTVTVTAQSGITEDILATCDADLSPQRWLRFRFQTP